MSRREVPNDPDRRERILDAALAVIAERGVHGTSHRRIAERAQVPLGSLTYYFAGIDDLFARAFERLELQMHEQYRRGLDAATTTDEAVEAVVDLICGPGYTSEGFQKLLFELYSYGNHDPATRAVAADWLARSRAVLMQHFSEPVARALDALIEALPMHANFERRALHRDEVRRIVQAVVTGLDTTARP